MFTCLDGADFGAVVVKDSECCYCCCCWVTARSAVAAAVVVADASADLQAGLAESAVMMKLVRSSLESQH